MVDLSEPAATSPHDARSSLIQWDSPVHEEKSKQEPSNTAPETRSNGQSNNFPLQKLAGSSVLDFGDDQSERFKEFLEEQFILSTRYDQRVSQKHLFQLKQNEGKLDALLHSYSVLALLQMRKVQIMLLLFALLCAAQMSYLIIIGSLGQTALSSLYRFTILEVRGTADGVRHHPTAENVRKVGVTWISCTSWAPVVNVSGAVVIAAFDEPVRMNGWSFTLDGVEEADPIKWTVEALDFEAEEEEDADATIARYLRRDGLREWWHLPPTERHYTVTLFATTVSYWGALAASSTASAGLLLVFLNTKLGRFRTARTALVGCMVAIAVTYAAIVAALRTQGGEWNWMALAAAISLLVLAPCIVVARAEKFIVQALFGCGAVGFVLLAVEARSENSHWMLNQQEAFLWGLLCLAAVFLLVYRRRKLAGLRCRIKGDIAAMKEALAGCWEEDAGFGEVTALLCSAHPDVGVLRQTCLHEDVDSMSASVSSVDGGHQRGSSQFSRHRKAQLVSELDQLYAQAACCTELLRDKVQALAYDSHGMVAVTHRPRSRPSQKPSQVLVEYMRWRDICHDSDMAGMVLWTPMKPYGKAMEKAIYHYRGDASRLVDICREMLVFESAAHIAQCLQAMRDDPEIAIVRVRNTLDPDVDASWSAGFKAVYVKLRVVNEVSRALAVASHVCELILTLTPIAQGVSWESYTDYRLLKRLQDAKVDLLGTSLHRGDHTAAAAPDTHSLVARTISRDWNSHRARPAQVVPYPSVKGPPVLTSPSPVLSSSAEPPAVPPLGTTDACGVEKEEVGAVASAAEVPVVAVREEAGMLALPVKKSSQRIMTSAEADLARAASGHPPKKVSFGDAKLTVPEHENGHDVVCSREARSSSLAWGSNEAVSEEEQSRSRNRVRTFGAAAGEAEQHAQSVGQHGESDAEQEGPSEIGGAAQEREESPAVFAERVGSLDSLASPDSYASAGRYPSSKLQVDIDSAEEQSEALHSTMCEIYLEQFRRRATLEGGDLDHWWIHLGKATASAQFAQVFNVSFPITSALSKTWFLGFSLIIGFTTFFLAVRYAIDVNLLGVVHVSQLRFRAIELRGGPDVVATGPVVGEFGLLRGGCKEPLDHLVRSAAWTELEVEIGETTSLDGFFFETVADDPAEDPTVFVLEGKSQGDGDWQLLGSSSKVLARDGKLRWEVGPAQVPEERREVVRVWFAVPWYAFLRECFSRIGIALCSWTLTWWSVRKRYHFGQPTIIAATTFLALCHLVEAVGRHVEGQYFGPLPLPYLTGAGGLAFSYSMRVRERFFMESITAYSFWCILLAAVEDLALDPAPGRLRDQAAFLVTGLMGVLLVLIRTRSRQAAVKTIAEDLRMYGEVWHGILADPDELHAMLRIPSVLAAADVPSASPVQEMQVHLPAGYRPLFASSGPRDLERRGSRSLERHGSVLSMRSRRDSRASAISSLPCSPAARVPSAVRPWSPPTPAHGAVQPPSPPNRGLVGRASSAVSFAQRVSSVASAASAASASDSDAWSVRRVRPRALRMSLLTQITKSKTKPVTSLGLLYTQAVGLHPLTTLKVKQWAKASRGRLPVEREAGEEEGGERFVLWEGMEGDAEQEARVRWPSLKKPERAIEKLVRTYGGKVCMLRDLVRHSLVFDKAAELVRCVEAIVGDKDVRIVEAKNRLRQDYDAWKTAGYRDVHLNLLLTSPLAEKLGVNTHVFELQLQLVPFAERKSAGGHKRYVHFRNALCL